MSVTPEYLLQLFRRGKDTVDIARLPDVRDALPRVSDGDREAQVARLIAYARDKERAAKAEEIKRRTVLV